MIWLGNELVRFALAGIGAAGLFWAASFGLVRSGVSPFWSSLGAYALAFAAGYTLQHGWTFGARHAHRRSLPRYALLQIASALVSGLTADVAVNYFGLSAIAMATTTTILTSTLGVVGSLFWVFAERHAADPRF
jgi:putative flippase GtrA